MRVDELRIRNFRNLSDLDFQIDGLWVVFGPNGAGKSNLLEAIAYLASLGRVSTRDGAIVEGDMLFRLDPDRQEDAGALRALVSDDPGVVVASIDGDLDYEIKTELEYWFQGLAPSVLQDRLFALLRESLKRPLVEWRTRGDEQGFNEDTAQLLVDVRSLPLADLVAEVVALVTSEMEAADDDEGVPRRPHWLAGIANKLRASPPIAPIELHADHLRTAPIAVVNYDVDPDRSEELMDAAVPDVHNSLWSLGVIDHLSGFGMNLQTLRDPWLEELHDGGVRVLPSLRLTFDLIGEIATELAPEFVRTQGSIVVQPRPIPEWSRRSARTWIGLQASTRIHQSLLGSGTRRWVGASVQEACRQLRGAKLGTLIAGASMDKLRRQAWDARSLNGLIELQHDPAPAVVLVDEPEAHLHPAAQAQVAAWLVELSRQHAAVVVASHSPAFLRMAPEHGRLSALVPTDDGSVLIALEQDLLGVVDDLGDRMGLDRADAMLLTQAVLLVEGKHDQLVLQHFFENDLRFARILVVPIAGVDNSTWLADSPLLPALGRPLRLIFDHVRRDYIERRQRPPKESTDEEHRAWELRQKFRELDFQVIPYEDPDIICALPEEAVRRAFPHAKFAGWDDLIARWTRLPAHTNFKAFVLHDLGLHAVRATAFVEAVIANSVEADVARPRLRQAVSECLASIQP